MKVYFNQSLLDRNDLRISIDDRLFRYGDGLFETIAVKNGKALFLSEHVNRLSEAMSHLGIKLDLNHIFEQAEELIKLNSIVNGILRIIISRGEGSRGFLPKEGIESYYILDLQTYDFPVSDEVKIMISSWQRPSVRAFPSNYKTANSLSSVLARIEASENNVFDAIQCDSNGHIIECSSANIVFFQKDKIILPKDDGLALKGITLAVFKEMMSEYKFEASYIKEKDLEYMDECYIMNSAIGIVSVSEVQSCGKFKNSHRKQIKKKYEEYEKKEHERNDS